MVDKILVTDDEHDIRELAKLILEGAGYRVLTADNPHDAIQLANKELPDLILMDIVMPGMSGFEACGKLKKNKLTADIPVILFSVLAREIDKQMAENAGASAYIVKPFKAESLLAKIKELTKESRKTRFSRRLEIEHAALKGRMYLLEFDPSAPYERVVREFVLEANELGEKVVTVSRVGSVIHRSLKDEDVELVELSSTMILSPYIHESSHLSVVYDNITDMVLSKNLQNAYRNLMETLKMLSKPSVTALFLINPSAHDEREINSIRGLFDNQISFKAEGMHIIKQT